MSNVAIPGVCRRGGRPCGDDDLLRARNDAVSQRGGTWLSRSDRRAAGRAGGFQHLSTLLNFGVNQYIVRTSSGVFVTNNIGAATITWTQLGAATTPAAACGLQMAVSGGTSTIFAKSGGCNGDTPGTLWRHQGTAAGGTWTQVPNAGAVGGFGVFGVDRNESPASDCVTSWRAHRSASDGDTQWRHDVDIACRARRHDDRERHVCGPRTIVGRHCSRRARTSACSGTAPAADAGRLRSGGLRHCRGRRSRFWRLHQHQRGGAMAAGDGSQFAGRVRHSAHPTPGTTPTSTTIRRAATSICSWAPAAGGPGA